MPTSAAHAGMSSDMKASGLPECERKDDRHRPPLVHAHEFDQLLRVAFDVLKHPERRPDCTITTNLPGSRRATIWRVPPLFSTFPDHDVAIPVA